MHCFGAKYKLQGWTADVKEMKLNLKITKNYWHASCCVSETCNPKLSVELEIHSALQQHKEGEKDERWGHLRGWLLWGQVACFELFHSWICLIPKNWLQTLMILFSAWGPPPRKYVCNICVVEVPCYDTLEKHKRGKEHIKREKDLEVCFQKFTST